MHEQGVEGEPIYLELVDALELYAAIIDATPAQAADQLRDSGGLESALARPRSHAHYEDADLALQAAVLAHGIAQSQTFIDANKRLALVAMLTFLELNGHRVEASDPDLAAWVISFSAGTTPDPPGCEPSHSGVIGLGMCRALSRGLFLGLLGSRSGG